MAFNYSIDLIWSDEDGAYLAQVKELPGCVADGRTPEEALQNIKIIAEEWLEVAREEGRPIPSPVTLEGYIQQARADTEEFQTLIQSQVEDGVKEAVRSLLPQILEAARQHRGYSQEVLPWRQRGAFKQFTSERKEKVS